MNLSSVLSTTPWRAWLGLLVVSVLFSAVLELLGLPAALLLGPMIVGIVFSLRGSALRIGKPGFYAAQTMIGCLVARSLEADVVVDFFNRWWLFLSVTLLVLGIAATQGWILARKQVLPGTTAIWGTPPGAASVMVILSESGGGDPRLVAFMQYLRVLMVAGTASIVAAMTASHSGMSVTSAAYWFPPFNLIALLETLMIAAFGGWLGIKLKIPGGALLTPLAIGAALTLSGVVELVQPPWLLAISYMLLGWRIGLGFTLAVVRYAMRAFWRILFSIVLLMVLCGGLAIGLVVVFDIDPLTAYLATSPGGLDSVAIIAASTDVDVGLIMTFQTLRFLLVLLISPMLARALAKRLQAGAASLRPE
ncbi:hypothetical protein BGP77_14615 [Saccharospirillum sp. MSK14-1]|uniref:AbrB family transcriptional regulator n=1 Tax=Saccharospirillum sp. MSK14-1 TaxID=1897632 RepID=UPI000D3989E1|nr:AbrB family transcriptional regulator [Saccharospirillum sp. MSK14-1]PTY37715.1 hypothetical protein BGP77_14615 [Saccharospirillum sp. MSK14-1]